jgi:NAD(P)-dependent dehydrogenase (short-subunit alcohol dehydrogenase family)
MAHVCVIGASRGIGLEFVRQYRDEGWEVTATARDGGAISVLRDLGAAALTLDVADAQSCSRLAWQIDGARFDVVLFVAGVLSRRTTDIEAPDDAEFDQVMHANVLGPMRVLPQFGDAFARDAKLALLSSRMGSIRARTGHGSWLYRASKAAANSVLKDLSLAWAGRVVSVAFHPGWVRTDMGGADADLTPQQSVADMRRTISRLTPADNGRFLNHDGKPIDW